MLLIRDRPKMYAMSVDHGRLIIHSVYVKLIAGNLYETLEDNCWFGQKGHAYEDCESYSIDIKTLAHHQYRLMIKRINDHMDNLEAVMNQLKLANDSVKQLKALMQCYY